MPEPDFRELAEDANDMLYVHDLDGRFLWVNRAGQEFVGRSLEELRTLTIADVVHPDDLPAATQRLDAKVAGHSDRTPPYTVRIVRPEGPPLWIEVSTRVLVEDGRPIAVQGIARDLTDRRHADAVQRLVHDLTDTLLNVDDLDDALAATVRAVCDATGWDYGEAWRVGPEGLEPAEAFHCAREGLGKFERISRRFRFAPGEGVPGRVAAERRSLAVRRDRSPPEFLRAHTAAAAGLHAALGVPVPGGDGPLAVLMFFHEAERAEDRGWRQVVEDMARQIGSVLARCDREDRLRRRLFLAAGAVDHGEPLLLTGLDGAPLGANRAFLDLIGVRRVRPGPVALDTWAQLLDSVDDPEHLERKAAMVHEVGSGSVAEITLFGTSYRRRRVVLQDPDALDAAHAWVYQTMRSNVSNENPSGPTS